ncbi:MAG: helix-turn-helix domain-containing protein [Proteobacteria bacterium]|nr:helix-turn-helix domain-containing protein [Pseudomonadota bacterium]
MPAIALIVSDRPAAEGVWFPALTRVGFEVRRIALQGFGEAVCDGVAVVVDAASQGFDEDELLSDVGLARAVGAQPAVDCVGSDRTGGVEDVLEDLCRGLLVRTDQDVARVAAGLARRCDAHRSLRFEYVSVSPRKNEVLAILGDGNAVTIPRPLPGGDDGCDVTKISLAEDASSVRLTLASGVEVTVQAAGLVPARDATPATNGHNGMSIDGARLGARLRELRLQAGLTQAELARRTGIHRPNIARVEAGRHTPSLETLARLTSAIGVPTTRVLAGD